MTTTTAPADLTVSPLGFQPNHEQPVYRGRMEEK